MKKINYCKQLLANKTISNIIKYIQENHDSNVTRDTLEKSINNTVNTCLEKLEYEDNIIEDNDYVEIFAYKEGDIKNIELRFIGEYRAMSI